MAGVGLSKAACLRKSVFCYERFVLTLKLDYGINGKGSLSGIFFYSTTWYEHNCSPRQRIYMASTTYIPIDMSNTHRRLILLAPPRSRNRSSNRGRTHDLRPMILALAP